MKNYVTIREQYLKRLRDIVFRYEKKLLQGVDIMSAVELEYFTLKIEQDIVVSIAHFFERQLIYSAATSSEEAPGNKQVNIINEPPSFETKIQESNRDESMLMEPKLGKDAPSTTGKGRRIDKRSITVLKDWVEKNFHDPYPSLEEKQLLCKSTGLSHKQITSWFINMRSKGKDIRSRKLHRS